MISCSTFYNFTLSCTIAAGHIYKPDTHKCTEIFSCHIRGWEWWKKIVGRTKCIHSSLNEREESVHQTLWLAICIHLSETVCYMEFKDRYTLTIGRNLASIDWSRLHHRYPITDYHLKNIAQHDFRLSKCSLCPTSGFRGPLLSSNSSI